MHDGWSKLISNFQPSVKAAPQQCLQKAGLYSSEDFPFGGTLGETFEAFAIESDLRLSRRKDLLVERLFKICNNRLVSLFAECVALNLQHVACGSKLNLNFTRSRDPAKASRPRDLKIDSGENSFPLEVANQLARYF